MGLRATSLALACWASSLAAQSGPVTDAWESWMAEHRVSSGAFVVITDGHQVEAASVGIALDAPQDVQSISKVLTGQCILRLIDDGVLAFDTPLADVLPEAETSPAAGVTMAQLLTHSGGIGPDSTQNVLRIAVDPNSFADGPTTDRALDWPLQEGTEYRYNNENFAILGRVIEAVTGQGALAFCSERLGLAASAPDRTFFGPSYGGWVVALPDLAAFAHRLSYAEEWPQVEIVPGIAYGPGLVMRFTDAGVNLWHYGAICLPWNSAGSALYHLPQGVTLAVTYDRCLSEDAKRVLEQQVLLTAAQTYATD